MDEQLIFRASLQDNASPGLKQLQTQAQQTGKAVGGSGKSAASGLDVLNRATNGALSSVNRFSTGSASALGRFNRSAMASAKASGSASSRISAGFKRAAVGIVGAFGAIQIAMAGWKRLTSIEDAGAKLRGLGNSASDVSAIMKNALAAVKGTAFGLDEAATAAAGAVAAGIKPGQQLETVLKAVANGAAAAGIGMGEMGAIFNKVASLGKAQNDVLQQVANQGLPIYQRLAEQFGVTADEVFKMATKGQIGFEQFQKAMTAAAGTVADEMGKTTTGMLRNMGAALSRFGALVLGRVQPIAKSVFGSITEGADEAGAAIGALFTGVGMVAGPVLRFFTSLPGPVQAVVLGLSALVLLHGPILKLFTVLGTPIRGIVTGLHGLTAGFTGAAASVGSFGWQMQLLQAKQGIGMTAGASKMGSFFTVAGRKAVGFGKSLLGAVGGPAGLAITGAIAAVTFGLMELGKAQERAKEKAEAHKSAIDALATALGQAAGDVGMKVVRDSASAALTGAKWGDSGSDITGLPQALGGRISQADMINSTLGDKASQAKINKAYEAFLTGSRTALPEADYTAAVTGAFKTDAFKNYEKSTQKAGEMFAATQKLYDSQIAANVQELNRVAGVKNIDNTFTQGDAQALIDWGTVTNMNDAFKLLYKSIGVTSDEMGDLGDDGSKALSKVTGATNGWRAASDSARKAMLEALTSPADNAIRDEWASIADATEDATEQAKTYQRLLDQINGRPVALDDALQVYNDSKRALSKAFEDATKGTKGNIEGLIGKDGRINTATETGSTFRTQLRNSVEGTLALVTATRNDAIKRGLGNDAADAAAQAVQDRRLADFETLAKKYRIAQPSVAAMANDLGLYNPAKDIYGPANLANAQKALTANMADAATKAQAAAESAGKTAGDAMNAGIAAGLGTAADWVQQNGWANLPVNLDMDPAYAALGGFKDALRQELTIRVNAQLATQFPADRGAGRPGATAVRRANAAAAASSLFGDPVPKAMGDIVRAPMIAKGGANILWAEPETDWEAYIPGSPKYRGRAEGIMAETARRLGGAYTPAAAIAKPMAAGGITGARATSSTGLAPISISVSVDARGADNPQEIADKSAAQIERVLVSVLRRNQERRI